MSGAHGDGPAPISSSYPSKNKSGPTHSRTRSGTHGILAFFPPSDPAKSSASASASSPSTRPAPASGAVSSQASYANQHATPRYYPHGHESFRTQSPPTGPQPSTTAAALASPGTGPASGLPVQGFVTPRTVLGLPQGNIRPMTPQRQQTLTVVDREQLEALVRRPVLWVCLLGWAL
jgi:hypothetical protein